MSTPIRPDRLDPHMAAPDDGAGLTWWSPRQRPFVVSGFPWLESDDVYRRLPVRPEWPLPPAVDALANATAGGQIRFRTDSARLAVRVRLTGPPDMDHMPATGQCGFDAYVGAPGAQRYWATARPVLGQTEYEVMIAQAADRDAREITLNFPLYQGVADVRVGLDPDAVIEAPTPYRHRRVVVYGTSITQGGCASRPGMAYTNILSRGIPAEFVNLGFSGNGKGEAEVAHSVASIDDVDCFVLDYNANLKDEAKLRETLPPFIAILRRRHPDVPILVLPRPAKSMEICDPAMTAQREAEWAALAEIVAAHRAGGDTAVEFLDITSVDVAEGTVDGSHPSDLGFTRLAEAIEPTVRRLLGGTD